VTHGRATSRKAKPDSAGLRGTRPTALLGRARWRALILAASLAVAGAAVCLALHPVVLARAGALAQITAALDGWQAALLLPVPGPDRRAGHATPELVRRLDRHAAVALREVGTASFAARQAAARRAAPGIIVSSSYRVIDAHVVRRFWDDDLLVDASVLSTVVRAAYDPASGTWRSPTTMTSAGPVQARVRDTFGVWSIVSVTP
jgi:hypothetical protein